MLTNILLLLAIIYVDAMYYTKIDELQKEVLDLQVQNEYQQGYIEDLRKVK